MGLLSRDYLLLLRLVVTQIILCSRFTMSSIPNFHQTDHQTHTVYPIKLRCEDVVQKLELVNKAGVTCQNIKNIKNKQFYTIESIEHELILELEPNDSFLAPMFQIEERYGDLYKKGFQDVELRKCFYDGRIVNEKQSNVILNICGGLQGVISSPSHGDFLISPLSNNTHNDGAHLLSIPQHSSSPAPKSKSKSGISDSSKEKPIVVNGYSMQINRNKIVEIIPAHSRKRRSLSVKRYIEMMIVTDQSMFEFFGKDEVELRRYILSVMAIVRSIMKDSSIGNFIELSIMKLIILKKNPHGLQVSQDSSKTLKRFSKWQNKQNKPFSSDPEHFDTAFLITKKDLCSPTAKCDTLGIAELGTICNPIRSCGVVEDNGLSVAFTIAHEVGHLLNAPHDGDHIDCKQNDAIHIMTPTFSARSKTWSWSQCSRKFITDFVESPEASCLLDKPSIKFEHPLPLKLPGEMFSMDEQCKLVYGNDSSVCPFVKRCDILWCIYRNNGRKFCKTNNMPWADGTKCDVNSWCRRGKCIKRRKTKPVHGGWGNFGPYGNCSRPCGGGVKYTFRKCNNPTPAYDGHYCTGKRRQYQSCNTHECPDNSISFRAEQCQAFNGRNLRIPGVPASASWLPKTTGLSREESCKLFCEIKGYRLFYELAAKVIDGTKCRKGANDICVDGQCKPAGCDNVLNSKSKFDKCGVCNGNNKSCKTYYGSKNNTYLGYNFVVTIPQGASRLRVTQVSTNVGKHDTNFLALLDEKKKYIFNGKWRVSLGRKRYTSSGTAVFYSGPNSENETIWVPGTLNKAMQIKVLSMAKNNQVNIRYSYNYPIQGVQKFRWTKREAWSGCYPVCKGHQVREFVCRREIDSQLVNDSFCNRTKKPHEEYRKCNQDCTLRWSVIESECTPFSACGRGIQVRKIQCVIVSAKYLDGRAIYHKHCRKANIGKMPPREVPCYAPCTSLRWVYTSWNKCNQTCGGGSQSRQVRCVNQGTNETVSDKRCKVPTKSLLTRPCNIQECPSWHTGAWAGVCSVTCGHGVVERMVYCIVSGKTVSPTLCDKKTKPGQTRPCIMSSCAVWKVRAWSKCSKSCGAGHKIREVYCETGTGEKVNEIECNTADKPIDRKKCFENACQLKAQLLLRSPSENNLPSSIRWLTGSFGVCSKTCDYGYRERVVVCVSNNIIVPDERCAKQKKPVKREICNTFSCPFWRHGQWSKCAKMCGTGRQSRLVLCGFNGTIVSDSHCITKKPLERRYCNKQDCLRITNSDSTFANTHGNWKLTEWSECSTTCGDGFKERVVTCMGDKCPNKTKPATVTSCIVGSCPRWNYGQWAPCYSHKGCGLGWQARLVVCQREDGSVLRNEACDAKYKPANNQTCQLEKCKQNARWSTTPWQPCNVACGDGKQFRYISCEDLSGNNLPESRCLEYQKKPKQEKTCRRTECPSWHTGNWGECDSSCHRQRSVFCMTGKKVVNDNLCKLDVRPVEESECSSKNCIKEPVFTWKVEPWSSCGQTCGYSLRSRNVKCTNELDLTVEDIICRNTQPVTVEQCFEGPCLPKWESGSWSECSASCGSGVQSREVYCKGSIGENIQDKRCEQSEKLATKRECNLGKCGDTLRWVTELWSQCSKSCGIGRTKRDVICVNKNNKPQPRKACDAKNMPTNMKVCNIYACPMLSCRHVQRELGVTSDGENTLQVGNRSLVVYCEGMNRKNPKEYITLKADHRENYSEIYGKRLRKWSTCPNNGRRQIPCANCIDYTASGVTFFKKVRLDIKRMVIVPEDKTFADQFGRNPPGFASAGDCYSRAKCAQGRFMVNLKNTGLRIQKEVTWTSRGYHTSKRIRRLKDSQLIYGKCGGYCGMCSPNSNTGLKVEIIHR